MQKIDKENGRGIPFHYLYAKIIYNKEITS